MSSKMSRWRGISTLAWVALIAALAGAGVLIEGRSPRAAWAQVEVFVTNYLGDSVTTYSRTTRGFRVPLRIIGGPATNLLAPAGVVVDTVNNEILVANISSITVYSLTANGDAAPLRTISGAATGLSQPIGLAVDTVHNEVLVANDSSITIYSRTASGNVAPLRTISGPSTQLMDPFGLAVDAGRGEVLVANFGAVPGPEDQGHPGLITVYNRAANGDVAPIRAISGPATGLQHPRGLVLDTVNNQVLVVNSGGSDPEGPPQPPAITVYNRTANGNVPPVALRTISGAATGLQNPIGLAVDTVNNEVLVANFGGSDPEGPPPTVTLYSRTASGNAAPLRVIQGPATELEGPAFPLVAATCPPVFDFDFSGNAYARCFRELLRGDQITAGKDLGGTGHDSVNVKGSSGSVPTTWLTVYDATPATPAAGPTFGAQTLCADLLVVPFDNTKGAGVVALLNEGKGKKGLALLLHDAGNTDKLLLVTVDGDPAQKGKLTTLASVPLQSGIIGNNWYRLIMTVDPASLTVTGKVFRHSVPTDPNSALIQVGDTLTYHPSALPAGVTSSGENGILGSAINAVLNVSVTNFTNNAAQCGS